MLKLQSDKKENQNARDTNATIRQNGKPKCERLKQQSGNKEN